MDEKILRKIKRCLAMARSDNPTEAATALRQAQALMDKHNISDDQVAISEVQCREAKTGSGETPPSWIARLINLIAHAFAVVPIYRPQYMHDRWCGRVEFLGIDDWPEVAGYAFEVLLRQLRADRNAYVKSLNKRLKQATKVRRGDLYATGWLQSVSKLVSRRTLCPQEQQLLEAYQAQHFGKDLETTTGIHRRAQTRDTGAFHQGLMDGRKVQYFQGVKGTATPKRIGGSC